MTEDQTKRRRFQQLRALEWENKLTQSESSELAALTAELEQAEAARLQHATDRIRTERLAIEEANEALKELVARREALAARLGSMLSEARSEQKTIEAEVERILAGTAAS